jgi:hypothetical protein
VVETPDEYLEQAPEAGRPWLREFWQYVESTYPGQSLTMFRQTPMFKFGRSYLDGYVMFTAAKTHFAVHAIDFDLVQQARASIPRAAGGKGNVSVQYAAADAKPALRAFVDAVMARHGVTPAGAGAEP